MAYTGMNQGISRRGFLTGTLAAGAAAATGGLAACKPKVQQEADPAEEPEPPEPSFFTAPDAVDESKIAETVTADIVVVGAGDAGLAAAFAASNAGAKVVLLEKSKSLFAHGNLHACLGTKLHEQEGRAFDANSIVRYLSAQSNNQADPALLRLWANESGSIYNTLIDLAEENGLAVSLTANDGSADPILPEFGCALTFTQNDSSTSAEDTPADLQSVLETAIRRNGGDIRYNTSAEQLKKNTDGRVHLVLARDENNTYTEFVGTKAVILATGDYGNNEEMRDYYCAYQTHADANLYQPAVNTGDGHKMGLWIGAAMQKHPHCPVFLPLLRAEGSAVPLAASPVLRVNALGKRYENEDIPAPLVCEGRLRQPGNKAWAITDSTWKEKIVSLTPGMLRTTSLDNAALELFEKKALSANTLEGLADSMNVPKEAFVETVKRYSECARNESDEDFGKSPNNLWTIEQAPFYAVEVPVATTNILGGLAVDDRLQVISADNDRKTISGLYAAGTTSGGFFGSAFPSAVPGIIKGWCVVSGYLAGLNAADEKA